MRSEAGYSDIESSRHFSRFALSEDGTSALPVNSFTDFRTASLNEIHLTRGRFGFPGFDPHFSHLQPIGFMMSSKYSLP